MSAYPQAPLKKAVSLRLLSPKVETPEPRYFGNIMNFHQLPEDVMERSPGSDPNWGPNQKHAIKIVKRKG